MMNIYILDYLAPDLLVLYLALILKLSIQIAVMESFHQFLFWELQYSLILNNLQFLLDQYFGFLDY